MEENFGLKRRRGWVGNPVLYFPLSLIGTLIDCLLGGGWVVHYVESGCETTYNNTHGLAPLLDLEEKTVRSRIIHGLLGLQAGSG